MKQKLLTKSNYLTGLQCPKLLWITKNDKERIPKPDAIAQKKFDDGSLVGELATLWYSEGESLAGLDFEENLNKTKELIKKRIPIFEAGFKIDRLFSRADILVPAGEDEWDIIEVKSATKVKDINLNDVAFQKYVYEKAGLKIRNCFLMHINNAYVLNNQIEPSELFIQADITEEIIPFEEDLENNIEKIINIIDGEEPKFSVDDILTNEYDNICIDDFMASLPENNIFDFYRMLSKKKVSLFKDGYKTMKDVPESVKLNEKQQIQKKLAYDGGQHIDKQGIKNFLDNLQYPIYYLDFETINPILPKFNGMKPYQRIPFQFSLHIQEEKGGELKHVSFLADGTDEPRTKFLKALKDNLGYSGSILVYNQGFEKGVFRECSTAFPRFEKWYNENIEPRIMDLWDVFRNFYYYDQSQKGSASIKYVLPAVIGRDKNGKLKLSEGIIGYEDMVDVKKGDQASYEYERVTFDSGIWPEDKKKIRDALEKYCELDTLAEVLIVDKLWGVVE
jgi:hypothetical protein